VPLTFGDDQQATEALSHLKNIDFIETGYLLDKEGNVFATYPDTLNKKAFSIFTEQQNNILKDGFFYVYEPVIFQNEKYGTLLIKANSKPLRIAKKNIIITLILLSIVLDILSIFLAIKMQRYISTPIIKLKNHFDKIAENQDFSARVLKLNNDEIGSLYDGFNNMLEQITVKQKERDNAMVSLKESEEKYRTLIKSTPSPLCLVDTEGNIVYTNDRFTKTFGYTLEDIPTLDEWWIKAYPDLKYRTWVLDTWNNTIDKAKTNNIDIESVEYEVTCKEGNKRIIIISGISLHDGFLATFIDITERKQAEIEIENLNENLEKIVKNRTKQLETANKELEAFSYSVSHDLKAPLRAVTGFSQILKEDYGEQLDSEAKRIIDRIHENAENMGMLINDLLNFSRMGRTIIQKSEVDIQAITTRVKNDLNEEIQGRKFTFKIQQMPLINADEKLIYHVMLNLVSNAVKFTGKLKNAIVEIGCTSQNNENVFYVKDNGIGFNMKYAGKIFDVFQRLHSVDEFPGTGIGLSIVQRIIHKHEGEIWVESEINKGTTVFFSI
jgi:PAS domain S-box-containing protein